MSTERCDGPERQLRPDRPTEPALWKAGPPRVARPEDPVQDHGGSWREFAEEQAGACKLPLGPGGIPSFDAADADRVGRVAPMGDRDENGELIERPTELGENLTLQALFPEGAGYQIKREGTTGLPNGRPRSVHQTDDRAEPSSRPFGEPDGGLAAFIKRSERRSRAKRGMAILDERLIDHFGTMTLEEARELLRQGRRGHDRDHLAAAVLMTGSKTRMGERSVPRIPLALLLDCDEQVIDRLKLRALANREKSFQGGKSMYWAFKNWTTVVRDERVTYALPKRTIADFSERPTQLRPNPAPDARLHLRREVSVEECLLAA
jgi:hypothetical protein